MHDAVGALERAKTALTEGRWDDRSIDGARANALESIAWSLIGLLGAQVQGERPETTLEVFAERAGLVDAKQR